MPEQITKHHYLFEDTKANKSGGYSFKIESRLSDEGKHGEPFGMVKLVCYKMDSNNKRTDLSEFFLRYDEFYVMIELIRTAFTLKKPYELPSYFAEREGKKRTLNVSLADYKGKFSITFRFNDGVSAAHHKGYSGQTLFTLNDQRTIRKLFRLTNAIQAFENKFIDKILEPVTVAI